MIFDVTFRITDGQSTIDFLAEGSGFQLTTEGWAPNLPQYKGNGSYTNPALFQGRRLQHGEYDNVKQTFQFDIYGRSREQVSRRWNKLSALIKKAADYGKEQYQNSPVWCEMRINSNSRNIPTLYSEIVLIKVTKLGNVFGQPFNTAFTSTVIRDLTIEIEHVPGWGVKPPGQILGPYYNVIRNSDFELWDDTNSVPVNWSETDTMAVLFEKDSSSKFGNYCVKSTASNSTGSGQSGVISQTLTTYIEPGESYTIAGWVRHSNITSGRVVVWVTTGSGVQTVYQSSDAEGWTQFYAVVTFNQTVTCSISIGIESTASGTTGTAYFDGLMFLKGDHRDDIKNKLVPVMSSSIVDNQSNVDQLGGLQVGAVNYVDVWNVVGDSDALVRFELRNTMTPTSLENPSEVIARAIVGMRRTGDVTNFVSVHKAQGEYDNTAYNNQRITHDDMDTDWKESFGVQLHDSITDNLGRFRIFARVKDRKLSGEPTLLARLKYSLGSSGVYVRVLDFDQTYVRNFWTLIDLTKRIAANMDLRGQLDDLSSIDMTLEVKRSTGSEDAYIDCFIRFPTEGGFIDATINPPLEKNSILIIDNTQDVQDVSATFRSNSLQPVFKLAEIPEDAVLYKNALYIVGGDKIASFDVTTRTTFYENAAGSYNACERYNGLLHYSDDTDVHYTNGSTHSASLFSLTDSILSMIAYNGVLYTGDDGGTIYEWDGSSSSLSTDTSQGTVDKFAVYQDLLCAGTGNEARVYVYDPDTTSWGLSYTFPNSVAEVITAMEVYDNKLYVATDQGNLAVWDRNSWSTISTGLSSITALKRYQDGLYLGSSTGALYVSLNGSTFAKVRNEQSFNVKFMAVFNGILHIFDNNREVWTLSNNALRYKVTDYSGSLFMAPPTDRHRYIVNFERSSRNSIRDDQAMVGIGLYPLFSGLGYVS